MMRVSKRAMVLSLVFGVSSVYAEMPYQLS
jgi:hypothetical protein